MQEIILAFTGSLCAAALFNASRKNLFWTGLSGAFGWVTFSWLYSATQQAMLATFLGAVTVGLYSEIMARVVKSPATVFSVSGIFPIVPGIAAYSTIQYLVENKLEEAAGKAVETLAQAGAIAFGILLATAVFRFGARLSKESKSKDP